MKKLLAVLAVVVAGCGGGGGSPVAPEATAPATGSVTIVGADAAWQPILQDEALAGRRNAAAFFARDVLRDFVVQVVPDRAALDTLWRRLFGNPGFSSECWMIAAGNASGVSMLSPGAWATQSCGHDGADAVHRRGVVFHEVVHVHHAQTNAAYQQLAPWLVEGLAVYASGQHDVVQQAYVRELLRRGDGPSSLAAVSVSGDLYPVGGSLLAFVDARYGRDRLRETEGVSSDAELLTRLGTTEASFLAEWRAFVRAQS